MVFNPFKESTGRGWKGGGTHKVEEGKQPSGMEDKDGDAEKQGRTQVERFFSQAKNQRTRWRGIVKRSRGGKVFYCGEKTKGIASSNQ